MDKSHTFSNKKKYKNSTNLIGTLNFTEVTLISDHRG